MSPERSPLRRSRHGRPIALSCLVAVGLLVAAAQPGLDLLKRVQTLERKVKGLEMLYERVTTLEKTIGIAPRTGPAGPDRGAQDTGRSGEAPRHEKPVHEGPVREKPVHEEPLQDPTLRVQPNDPGRKAPPPPRRVWLSGRNRRGCQAEITELYVGPVMVKKSVFSTETEPTKDRWIIMKVVYSNVSHGWLWDTGKFHTGAFCRADGKDLRTWKEAKDGMAGFSPPLMGATRRKPGILRPGESYTMIEVFEIPKGGVKDLEIRVAIGDPWDLHKTKPFVQKTIRWSDLPRK